jgi:carbonic anhydrase
MNVQGILIERNERHRAEPWTSLVPRLMAVILTCADHRVDPAHVLGIDLGDAVVVRNAGGRVTPDALTNLTILATIAAIEGLPAGFQLIVMHHTDCGLSRLAGPGHAALLAGYFGVAANEVPNVLDPYTSVQFDVDLLRSLLPETVMVSGLVYDVATGKVRVVCQAAMTDS